MKYIIRVVVVVFCLHTLFYSVKYVIAEKDFLLGYAYSMRCNKQSVNYCLSAGIKMKQAIENNRYEYFYKYSLAKLLMRTYTFKKDKRLLSSALLMCNGSLKHSWDKHNSLVCFAQVYNLAGNKEAALYYLKKAKYYIPYNEELKGYINELEQKSKK